MWLSLNVCVGSDGSRRGELHPEQIVRLGEARTRVLVRQRRRAGFTGTVVVVGVVEVPVRVDGQLQRPGAQPVEVLLQPSPCGLHEGVDDDDAVGAVEGGDVAAGAREHHEVRPEPGRQDGCRAHLRASLGQRVGRRLRLRP